MKNRPTDLGDMNTGCGWQSLKVFVAKEAVLHILLAREWEITVVHCSGGGGGVIKNSFLPSLVLS